MSARTTNEYVKAFHRVGIFARNQGDSWAYVFRMHVADVRSSWYVHELDLAARAGALIETEFDEDDFAVVFHSTDDRRAFYLLVNAETQNYATIASMFRLVHDKGWGIIRLTSGDPRSEQTEREGMLLRDMWGKRLPVGVKLPSGDTQQLRQVYGELVLEGDDCPGCGYGADLCACEDCGECGGRVSERGEDFQDKASKVEIPGGWCHCHWDPDLEFRQNAERRADIPHPSA